MLRDGAARLRPEGAEPPGRNRGEPAGKRAAARLDPGLRPCSLTAGRAGRGGGRRGRSPGATGGCSRSAAAQRRILWGHRGILRIPPRDGDSAAGLGWGPLFPGAPLRAPRSLAVLTFKEIWNRSFCRPREQLVDIITEFPNEVEYIFRPSCVSLQRCGGCCGDEGLRCVPVQTGTVTVQVSTAPWGRGWRWAPGKLCTRGLPSSRCCRRPARVPGRRGTYARSVSSSGRSGETSGGTDLSLPFPAPSSVRGP